MYITHSEYYKNGDNMILDKYTFTTQYCNGDKQI